MNQSSKINLLLVLLIVSLGLNIYELTVNKKLTVLSSNISDKINCCDTSKDESNTIKKWTFCNNEIRFDNQDLKDKRGGQEIRAVDADKLVIAYFNKHKKRTDEFKTTGFIFSKKAIDEIFNDPDQTINSVRFDLALNGNYLSLVARGITRYYTGITNLPSNEVSSRIYRNQAICPADCLNSQGLFDVK